MGFLTRSGPAMRNQYAMKRRRSLPLLAGGLGLVAAAACAVSVQEERQLGDQYAAAVDTAMPVIHDPAVQAPLDAAVRPLVAVATRRDLPWTFRVVNTTDVNAFAIPGGHIYVTRGLIEHATSYNQLASVLGHEIGHVDLRHTARQPAPPRKPAARTRPCFTSCSARCTRCRPRHPSPETARDRDETRVKVALTIAGSDSGGGAGIQADLKTFHQFGVFGTSVVTAVTAQNTVGVLAWQALPAELVTRQIDALADDLPPAAVKSGMLGSAELVETVAAGIARRRLPSYVLDPVMVATSGDRLLDSDAEQLIGRRLVPLARLVTPNLDEAAILTGGEVRTPVDMERAGRALLELGAQAALVKGGHLPGSDVVDVLMSDGMVRRFSRPRLDTTSTHR